MIHGKHQMFLASVKSRHAPSPYFSAAIGPLTPPDRASVADHIRSTGMGRRVSHPFSERKGLQAEKCNLNVSNSLDFIAAFYIPKGE
jgi:hypothetical protein